ALVAATGWEALPDELRAELATELNVQTVETLSGGGSDLVDVSIKPNFRALGRRFGRRTPAVAAALGAADPAQVAADLRGGTVTVSVDGDELALTSEEVIVTETPREGWAVSGAGGESVALDLEVTPELRRAGLAREVVRLVQEARKTQGLDVSDRIALWWSADSTELATALREHADLVAGEVLATSYAEGDPDQELPARRADDLELTFWLRRA
ncbi:MAG: isoleucine--tRNA ligase, partial [Acidothermales bacterium]|nr:isoleucine--tRNA ligase [Acidothermales bacterium]